MQKSGDNDMGVWDLLGIAIGLAMDAFAVSICKGLATKKDYIKTGFACGIWFGFFQALMPLLGWLLGRTVAGYISNVAPYIAFALLAFLGIKMIVEAIKELGEIKKAREEGICDCCADEKNASLSFKVMIVFAIATSIDALAAGLSFAAMNANIWVAIAFIGIVTFLFSFIGATLGAKIGGLLRGKAEIFGGIVLIGMGLKVLIQHLIELLAK
jgi:putative Mn2+ efflux pump MntP